MRDAITSALADRRVRVVVIASAVSEYFSAGADLREFERMKAPDMRQWVALCHEIARLLRSSPKPLLAAIAGVAVGGGLEMTLHCDLRFAGADAKLGQPEIRIAFIPPIATTQALARLLGRPRAIRYLYEGRMLDASEALKWGLIDEVVRPEELKQRVQAYAEDLASKPPAALAAIRRTVTLGGGMTFEEGMSLEMEAATDLAGTADFAEGVSAFLNKRPPVWVCGG
jgi:enoyl-CoA hydratase